MDASALCQPLLGPGEGRKYSVRPLGWQLLQGILVVQTSEHRLCPDAAILRNLVTAFRGRGRRVKRHWNAWPKTLVWTAVIEVRDPLKKRAFQMVLGKRNDKVQALSLGRAHNPFAKRISLWGAHRRP